MRSTASSDAPEGEAAPLHSIMRSDGKSGKELGVKYHEEARYKVVGNTSGVNLGIVVAWGQAILEFGDRFRT